jgi:hypothetical protein
LRVHSSSNIIALISILPYVRAILDAVHPEALIKILVSNLKNCQPPQKIDYILALEEIGVDSAQRGHSHLAIRIVRAYEETAYILLGQWKETKYPHNTIELQKCLEIIPSCLQHLIVECGKSGQENVLRELFDIGLILMAEFEKSEFRHNEISELADLCDLISETAVEAERAHLVTYVAWQLEEKIPSMLKDGLKISPYQLVRRLPNIVQCVASHDSDFTVNVCEAIYDTTKYLKSLPEFECEVEMKFAGPIEHEGREIIKDGMTLKTHFKSDLLQAIWESKAALGGKEFNGKRWPFKNARRLLDDAEKLIWPPSDNHAEKLETVESGKRVRIPGSDWFMVETHESNKISDGSQFEPANTDHEKSTDLIETDLMKLTNLWC